MEVVLAPLQLLPATVAGVLYVLRVNALRGTPRAVPAWRQWSFLSGLVLIVATLTLIGSLSEELFVAHMAEHLLIADIGALLLVLGLTAPVLAPLLRREPETLREQLCVGPPDHCAELLSRYAATGCERVLLWPLGDEARQIELAAEVVRRSKAAG